MKMNTFKLLVVFTLLLAGCATDMPEELKDNSENDDEKELKRPSFFIEELAMEFVSIPAGTFLMGSPVDEPGRENTIENQHPVTLTNEFYIQSTELTRGQWRAIAEAYANTGLDPNPSYSKSCIGDDCPVDIPLKADLAWQAVMTYIATLNQIYAGKYNFRLPTEAEWEYAARAESVTAYANGDVAAANPGYCDHDGIYTDEEDPGNDRNLNDMGWYCFNADYQAHPVAGKKPNKWGLYDMHGNVYEWCADCYDGEYPSSSVTNPTGPAACEDWQHVFRSGSWGGRPQHCRSAARNYYSRYEFEEEEGHYNDIGFRLVCERLGK